MQEVRCKECNKLLMKIITKEELSNLPPEDEDAPYIFKPLYFQIKCPRCGHMNTNKGECQE